MAGVLTLIRNKLVRFSKISSEVFRGQAAEAIECELEELENIFGVLVLGSFIGLPSPPMQISLDLMPHMEKDLILMMEKVDTAHQPISQLFSVLKMS
jgi:hypothetical protein